MSLKPWKPRAGQVGVYLQCLWRAATGRVIYEKKILPADVGVWKEGPHTRLKIRKAIALFGDACRRRFLDLETESVVEDALRSAVDALNDVHAAQNTGVARC